MSDKILYFHLQIKICYVYMTEKNPKSQPIEFVIQNGYKPLSWNAFEESKIHKISCKIKNDITEIWSRALIDTKPRLSVHGQIVTKSEWGKQNNNCSS